MAMPSPRYQLRVLIVEPLGAQPWCRTDELCRAIEQLGHQPLLVDEDDVPWPRAYMPPRTRIRQTTMARAIDRAQAYSESYRRTRALLARLSPDVILVWDAQFAAALRAARPATSRLVWVTPESLPESRRERLLRASAALGADAVVVPNQSTTLLNLARQVVVSAYDGSGAPSDSALGAGWAVLGGAQPTESTMESLAARGARRPASAVVVDARNAEVAWSSAERITDVVCASRVEHAVDDSWLDRLEVGEVVDPAPALWSLDHRHRAALGRGCRVLVAADAGIGPAIVLHGGSVGEPEDGFRELKMNVKLVEAELSSWAAAALLDPLHPRAAVVATMGLAIDQCPSCRSSARKELRQLGPSTIFRCDGCSLTYGSPKVPDDVVYDDGYHDGTGGFGTDYVHARWYCEQVSDDRLRCFERAGVPRGSMVDLGTGLGHFVARARAQGWQCDGVELVDAAVRQAKELYDLDLIKRPLLEFEASPRYDVAALGQTLEHFVEPGDALRHIRESILAPGGYLLIEVPHIDGLNRRLRRRNWLHWQSGDHVSYFSRSTLTDLLERQGYDVVHSETSSGVYPGLGSTGVMYSLGLFDAMTRWGSALRAASRIAKQRLDRTEPARAPGGTRITEGKTSSVAEGTLLRFATLVDRVGLGDNLRVVARVR